MASKAQADTPAPQQYVWKVGWTYGTDPGDERQNVGTPLRVVAPDITTALKRVQQLKTAEEHAANRSRIAGMRVSTLTITSVKRLMKVLL